MNFLKLASDRYSVRKFNDKPLEKEVVEKILEAARIAPTGCNYQPQRVLVINDDEALEKLKDCTRCHFDAPCAMLVCYNKDECWTRPYDGNQSGIVDASIVTTHMMLEVTDLGLGSTWVGAFDPIKAKETYNVPEHYEVAAILPVGYPSEEAHPSRLHNDRKSIDEIAFYNKF